MSGMGRHEYSTDYKSIWKGDLAICPYCGASDCEADWVDVGINLSSYQLDAVPVQTVTLKAVIEKHVLELAVCVCVSEMAQKCLRDKPIIEALGEKVISGPQ